MPHPSVDCASCPLSLATGGRCSFTQVEVPAGERVFAQGQPWDRAYFVREGLLTLSTLAVDGSEEEFAVRGPGALFGVEGLSGASSTAEVQALTDARLCVLSNSRFASWLGPERSPARAVLGLLLGELAERASDRRWTSGPSDARVAKLALAWADARSSGDFPVRQKQQMARLLGMRAETFSRSLTRLADAGLLNARTLRVHDRPRLERLANGGGDSERTGAQ